MEGQINVRVPKEMKEALERIAWQKSKPGAIVKTSDVVREIIERSTEYKNAAKEQPENV